MNKINSTQYIYESDLDMICLPDSHRINKINKTRQEESDKLDK